MKINEISMDRDQAQAAFEAYRAQVQKRQSHEDARIMRGFKALAQGKRLLHLAQTIKAAGTDTYHKRSWRREHGAIELPRLAVCRAHAEWCWIETYDDGSCIFKESEWRNTRARKNIRRLPPGTLGERNASTHRDFKAMVPVVPAALRPGHHLQNYHVLWEAEWSAVPPVDPYLLKHIGGDLYAIVAHWDLTELERAVMSERVQ